MAELSGQGAVIAGSATSVVLTTAEPIPFKKGQRMRDVDGNEYLFVEFSGTVYGRQPVIISDDNTAAAVGTTARGRVGVAVSGAGASDYGWVQIYGRAIMQIGGTGVSPSDAANGPTTLHAVATISRFVLPTSQTSPAGLLCVSGAAGLTSDYDYQIRGLWVASDASPADVSGTTAATSHTGGEIAVWLNFPEVFLYDTVSTS